MGEIKKILVPNKAPIGTSFKVDEIIVNPIDGKAYIKKNDNTVIELGAGSSGTFSLSGSGVLSSSAQIASEISGAVGAGSTFTLTADGGANQTISNGDTLDIEGSTNITTVVGSTDKVTVNLKDTITLTNITASSDISGSGQLFMSLSLDNSNHKTVMYNTASGKFFFTGSYGGGTQVQLNLEVPSDGTYDDGLLPFTASDATSTTIADAIDDINEVLAGLAPSAAPSLDDISGSFNGVAAKLSFGLQNTVSTHGGYTNVLSHTLSSPDNNFGLADVNALYQPFILNNDIKIGVIDARSVSANNSTLYTTITGILNDDVAEDAGTFVNHGANAFGDGDKGVLALYVNNNATPIHTQSLSGSGDPIASSLNISGSGFINISATQSANFTNSGNELTVFKHRSGSFVIGSGSQKTGWNYARVEHQLLGSTLQTNYVEWVNEVDSASLAISSENINDFTGAGLKHLSGVKYFTSFTATYKAKVTNVYKNVFSSDASAIDYGNSNSTVITFDQHIATGSKILHSSTNTVNDDNSAPTRSLPSPNSNIDNCEDTDLQLTASLKSNSNVACTTNGTAFTIDLDKIKHPIKTDITDGGSESVTSVLLDNRTETSTLQKETFVSESVGRIPSASYNTQTSATNAINTFNSQASIASTGDLLVAPSDGNGPSITGNGVLVYPDNINGGNYAALTNGPGSNVNYSSVSGKKDYYRIFKNESGGSLATVVIKIKGSATLVTVGSEDNSSNDISCRIKYPDSTGYLDLGAGQADGANLATDNTPSNASGTPDTTIDSSGATNTLNLASSHVNFAGNTIANNEHIVVNLQTGQGFTGRITEIEITNFT